MNDILTTVIALLAAVISGYTLLRKSSDAHDSSDIADLRQIIQTWQDSYGALVARMDILQAKTNHIIDENVRLIRQIAVVENSAGIEIANIRREIADEITQRQTQAAAIITLGEKLRAAEETIAAQALVIADEITQRQTQAAAIITLGEKLRAAEETIAAQALVIADEITQRQTQAAAIITLGEKLRAAEETIAAQALVIAELRQDLRESEAQRQDLKRLLSEAESKIAVLEAQVGILTGK